MSIEQTAKNNYGLCIEDCSFLEDKTIWVVVLSNGLTVHQDDERSGKEAVAWKRLARYCKSESVNIIGMHLKFRSHVIPIESGEHIQGYYFAYGAHKEFDENITKHCYVCGCCKNGLISYTWYKTPELLKMRQQSRAYRQDDIDDSRLILNNQSSD